MSLGIRFLNIVSLKGGSNAFVVIIVTVYDWCYQSSLYGIHSNFFKTHQRNGLMMVHLSSSLNNTTEELSVKGKISR